MSTVGPPRWTPLRTARLEIRHPVEDDRTRFVDLLSHPDFMVFSDGPLSSTAAARRFDAMVARCAEISFAKQPVVVVATGELVGYTGVDWMKVAGRRRLEVGWRLVPSARGRGIATEAAGAVLAAASRWSGEEVVAVIDPTNQPSRNVAGKLGFAFWRQVELDGVVRDVHRLRLGPP